MPTTEEMRLLSKDGDGDTKSVKAKSVGAPSSAGDLDEDLEYIIPDEISAKRVLIYLSRDIEKTRNYQTMPLYLLFLGLFTMLIVVTLMRNNTMNPSYYLNLKAKEIMGTDELEKINTMDDIWPWMEGTISRIYAKRMNLTGSSIAQRSHVFLDSFPIGLVALRQWRVKGGLCLSNDDHLAIPPMERRILGASVRCLREFSDDEVETEPYGPDQRFIPDKKKEEIQGLPVLGEGTHTPYRTYSNAGDQFSEALALQWEVDDALNLLKLLQKDKWIDSQTAMVSLDYIMYNFVHAQYVRTECIIEIFESGMILHTLRGLPFQLWSLDNWLGQFVFASDVIVSMCLLALAGGFVVQLQDKRKLLWIQQNSLIGKGEIFEILNILTFATTYIFRFMLWHQGNQITATSFYDSCNSHHANMTSTDCQSRKMYNALTDYATWSHISNSVFAPSIIFSYLRLFKYLQHNARLNVLSETVKESVGDLFGMCLIFFIVLIGYSIGGTLLFAHEVDEFQTFSNTVSYLSRVVLSGDLGLWDSLQRASPTWAGVYMITWVMITWLVLLNMILAVIAGAFAVVQENMAKGSEWSMIKVIHDVRKFIAKYIFRCVRNKSEEEVVEGGKRRRKKLMIDKSWMSNYIKRRHNMVAAIRQRYAKKDKGKKPEEILWEKRFFTLERLLKIVSWARTKGGEISKVLTDEEVERMFEDAQRTVVGEDVKLKVGERAVEKLLKNVEELQSKTALLSREVQKVSGTVEEHGIVLKDVDVRSLVTAKLSDSMSAQLKQAAAAIKDSADAVETVARANTELKYQTEDIALAVQGQAPILHDLCGRASSHPPRSAHTLSPQLPPRVPLSPPTPTFYPRTPPQQYQQQQLSQTLSGGTFHWGSQAPSQNSDEDPRHSGTMSTSSIIPQRGKRKKGRARSQLP